MSKVETNDRSLVVLEDVVKTYRMGEVEVTALNHTDLVLDKGEFVVILGPSGSGKTTLLNLIGGIDSPTEGTISVGGERISDYRRSELTLFRRRKVGFVFQFFNLIPTLTARENVEFALRLTAGDGQNAVRRSIELLELVGLGDRVDHFPYQLSGGEQQRVAVARALAKDPVLILGDEPTGNLDYQTGKRVLRVLHDVHLQGKTVVIVTHNQPLAAMGDRVLHLHDGRVSRVEINEHPAPPEELEW